MATPQQQGSDPKLSAFVMASAGTGKTKMLIDRIFRLLLQGIPLSSILCLTFTKAAAYEMYGRLFNLLEKLVHMDDPELQVFIEIYNEECSPAVLNSARSLFFNILDEQQSLKIQTIHSFCQTLLENNAHFLDLVPPFSIIDEEQKKEIILKSLHHICKKNICEKEFYDLTQCMSIHHFSDLILQAIRLKWEFIEKSMHIVIPELDIQQSDIDDLLSQLPLNIMEMIPNDDVQNFFLTKSGTPRKRILKKEIYTKNPELEDIINDISLAYESLLDAKKIKQCNTLNQAFFKIVHNVKKHFEDIKKEQSLLDFDDLVLKTNELLKSPFSGEIEQKLGYRIQAILVDEAQDTSPVQWEVITQLIENMLLAEEKVQTSLLVVGDLKQSIYSFQGADPAVFIEKQKNFKSLFTHYQKPFQILSLQKSYRCTAEILSTVDRLFNNNPAGLFLEGSLKHIPHRDDMGSITVISIKESKKIDDSGWVLPNERIAEKSIIEHLATDIVHQIEHLLSSNKKPEDIMILVRNRTKIVDALVKEMSKKNIPCSGLDRFLLKEHPLVEDFLNLFQWFLSQSDDHLFMLVLKSPFFNLTGIDELFLYDLIQNKKNKTLWQSLCDEYEKKDVSIDIKRLIPFLKESLNKVDYESLTLFLNTVWIHSSSLFLQKYGQEVPDVYDALYNVFFDLESQKCLTLQAVIWHIQTNDIDVKRDVAAKGLNQVRLLTVHGSKGLESPIVILADTNFKQTLQKEKLLFHNGTYLIKPADHNCPSCLKPYKTQALDLFKEEEKRLLYVALTRAKDHLYIFAKGTLITESWYDLIKNEKKETPLNIQENNKPYALTKDDDPFSIPDYFFKGVEKDTFNQPDFIQNKNAVDRGILLHELLEVLPTLNDHHQKDYATQFVQKNKTLLTLNDAKNAVSLIQDDRYRDLFYNGLSEMSLTYKGNLYRLDRFIKKDSDIIILDFKSGKRTTQKINIYKEKMALYKDAIQYQYQNSIITVYILWIDDWIIDPVIL